MRREVVHAALDAPEIFVLTEVDFPTICSSIRATSMPTFG
jgi:hypothetical protein